MNSKLWIQKALTTCSVMALVLTYSMVTLATSAKAVGELSISGSTSATSSVTVNGEPAHSGRTVFASSTISVPEGMSATINFGKTGKIQLGSGTTYTLTSDETSMGGDLAAGTVTVLRAATSVAVNTGELVELGTGETATAGSATAAKQTNNDPDRKWLWAGLIIGGAVVGVVWVAFNDNDSNLGGGTTVPSPLR